MCSAVARWHGGSPSAPRSLGAMQHLLAAVTIEARPTVLGYKTLTRGLSRQRRLEHDNCERPGQLQADLHRLGPVGGAFHSAVKPQR